MYRYKERDIGEITKRHERVQRFFYLSIPGALWFLEQLTVGGLGEKIIRAMTTQSTSSIHFMDTLPLATAFALWGIPFELSEHNLVKMKRGIKDYRIQSGDMTLPISYTWIDHTVNTIMKFAFDKTPLPK